jgi:hypothetical protein
MLIEEIMQLLPLARVDVASWNLSPMLIEEIMQLPS